MENFLTTYVPIRFSRTLCCGVCELVLFYQIGVSSGTSIMEFVHYLLPEYCLSAAGWIVFSDLVV
jgi:hypothetical protein